MLINVGLEISPAERERIALDYLKSNFKLDYTWEKNEIVKYNNCYHDDLCREVVGKVTAVHKHAKAVYNYLLDKSR